MRERKVYIIDHSFLGNERVYTNRTDALRDDGIFEIQGKIYEIVSPHISAAPTISAHKLAICLFENPLLAEELRELVLKVRTKYKAEIIRSGKEKRNAQV